MKKESLICWVFIIMLASMNILFFTMMKHTGGSLEYKLQYLRIEHDLIADEFRYISEKFFALRLRQDKAEKKIEERHNSHVHERHEKYGVINP